MRNLASLAILGIFVALQTGCSAGVAVTRPTLPTIVIGEGEPLPPPPPPPPPVYRRAPVPPPPPPPPPVVRHEPVYRPAPRPLHSSEAIAIGQDWCRATGLACWLDDAKLNRKKGVWRIKFDTMEPGHHNGRGKGHYKGRGRGHDKHHERRGEVKLEVDAFSGRILDVDFDD